MTESRTPAHTLDELKDSSPKPIISIPKEDTPHSPSLASLLGLGSTNKLPPGRQPAIATPTEPAQQPASLGERSVGIAAGDPKGGANVVAAAHTVSKGLVSSIKVGSGRAGGGATGGIGGCACLQNRQWSWLLVKPKAQPGLGEDRWSEWKRTVRCCRSDPH